ncbi:Uncharacterised protein [Sphingomonas paucimobilis]|nr:Uncharacterised protein [Sphingomonas paucimobilis]
MAVRPALAAAAAGAVRGLIVGVGVVGILLMVFAILGDATLDRVGEIQADWVERTELWDLYSRLAAAAPLGLWAWRPR